MSKYSIQKIEFETSTDETPTFVEPKSHADIFNSIDDPDLYLDSEESAPSEDDERKQEQDNVKDPNFLKQWTNIPTIEQFMKPSKYRDDYLLDEEAGEEEMEDVSSRDIESKDDLLFEKKDSEMMMDEEEASEQLPTTEQTEKAEAIEEEGSGEESESESEEDFQLPEYDDEAIEQAAARSMQASEAATFDALKELAPARYTKDGDLYKRGGRSFSDVSKYENYLRAQIVGEFLNDLVNKAVDVCEKVNITALYRFNLDKRKLIVAILAAYADYVVEMKISEVVNKKVVDYCRRKKLIRYLTIDNIKTIEFERGKLTANTKRLDGLLKMRTEINEHLQRVQTKLHKELEVMRAKAYAEVERFEALIKDSCHIESKSKNLLEATNNKFAAMAQVRAKISKIRYQLILKLDTKANLTDQLERIQNIGGFSTVKYDAVNNEIRQIQEKIDEKTTEHRREARRINEKIGKIVHVRDVTEISLTKLDQLILKYLGLRRELNAMRDRKSNAYNFRFAVKRELKIVKGRSGILDKKPLLREFDTTTDEVDKRQKIVKTMLDKVNELQARLEQLKQCKGVSISIRRSTMRPSENRSLSVRHQSSALHSEVGSSSRKSSIYSPTKSKDSMKYKKYSMMSVHLTNISSTHEKKDYSLICPAMKPTTIVNAKRVSVAAKQNDTIEMDGPTERYMNKIRRVRRFQNYLESGLSVAKSSHTFSKKFNPTSLSMLTLKSFTNLKGVEDIKYPYAGDKWAYKRTFTPL